MWNSDVRTFDLQSRVETHAVLEDPGGSMS